MRYHNRKSIFDLTHKESLEYLIQGNFRFLNALNRDHDHLEMINITSNHQWPFAVVLSCMDSRISNELIFDQGLGDIFSIRVAGNIITTDILGSLEYACKIAGSKLIVIVGHTKCAAIKGACDNLKLGNLTNLLNNIKYAVKAEKTVIKNRNSNNHDFVEKVCNIHLFNSIKILLKNSPVLNCMIKSGKVGIIPAKYNIEVGNVFFYKDKGIFN